VAKGSLHDRQNISPVFHVRVSIITGSQAFAPYETEVDRSTQLSSVKKCPDLHLNPHNCN
jgi:hypothetical protein